MMILKKVKNDKTKPVEIMSSITLFVTAMSLMSKTLTLPFDIHAYFWGVVLIFLAIMQYVAVKFEITVLRMSMAWVVGMVWTWFSFIAMNSVIAIPVLCIGAFNIYSFITLVNRVEFDWFEFVRD